MYRFIVICNPKWVLIKIFNVLLKSRCICDVKNDIHLIFSIYGILCRIFFQTYITSETSLRKEPALARLITTYTLIIYICFYIRVQFDHKIFITVLAITCEIQSQYVLDTRRNIYILPSGFKLITSMLI